MVRLTGLEPALLSELEPKSNVYANFTTGAYSVLLLKFTCRELAGNKCTVVTQPKSRASASSATPAYSILLLIFTCQSLQGINAQLSLRDSCGARNYLLAVAHIISTAAPLLTSLYLPQAALSRKAASSAILAY